jgi:hypothetical protein
MKVTIHNERIDITELPLGNRIQWNPILDELKSEHRPEFISTENAWA